jgi:hypothetical protein
VAGREADTANPEPLLARRENYSADAMPHRIRYLTAGEPFSAPPLAL